MEDVKSFGHWRAEDDSLEESGQAVDMEDERSREGVAASAASEGASGSPGEPRWTRRQALGRMSVVAAAGAAAWVAPEILTATPAGGAQLSGATEAAVMSAGEPATSSTSEPIVTLAKSLASTGLDLQRDATVGAAMLAGGWAMHHWASRPLQSAAEAAAETAGGAGVPAAEAAAETAGGAGVPAAEAAAETAGGAGIPAEAE